MKFNGYDTGDFFDEMFGENGQPRAAARPLARNIESLPAGELMNRQQAADQALVQMGITFNVYGESAGMRKRCPSIWCRASCRQRNGTASNAASNSASGAEPVHRRSLYDGKSSDRVVPEEIVFTSKAFRRQCRIQSTARHLCHITGSDPVRHRDGQIYVLEDNLRCPSGVSYVLENRHLMKV
jgi:uncharacterized circularly permuted ATP-grasp superfamily protein